MLKLFFKTVAMTIVFLIIQFIYWVGFATDSFPVGELYYENIFSLFFLTNEDIQDNFLTEICERRQRNPELTFYIFSCGDLRITSYVYLIPREEFENDSFYADKKVSYWRNDEYIMFSDGLILTSKPLIFSLMPLLFYLFFIIFLSWRIRKFPTRKALFVISVAWLSIVAFYLLRSSIHYILSSPPDEKRPPDELIDGRMCNTSTTEFYVLWNMQTAKKITLDTAQQKADAVRKELMRTMNAAESTGAVRLAGHPLPLFLKFNAFVGKKPFWIENYIRYNLSPFDFLFYFQDSVNEETLQKINPYLTWHQLAPDYYYATYDGVWNKIVSAARQGIVLMWINILLAIVLPLILIWRNWKRDHLKIQENVSGA